MTRTTRIARLILAVTSFGAATPAPGQSQRSCPGTWSPPFPVTREGGEPVYVEHGPIAAVGETTVAIGAPTVFWLTRDALVSTNPTPDSAQVMWALSRSGARIDERGVAGALPSIGGRRRRYGAHLLSWRSNELSVVLPSADVDPTTPRDRPPSSEMTGLDLATFDGTRWSDHLTIIRGTSLELSQLPVSRAEAPFAERVVAVRVRNEAAGPRVVRLARNVAGAWSTADWGDSVLVHYVSATTATDGATVLVAMITSRNGVAGVYSTRTSKWPPATADWSRLTLIDSLRAAPMRFGRFSWAHLGGDSLLVVWHQTGGSEHSIVTALTTDGAKQWRMLPPLVHDAGIDGETLAVDARGRVHVVFRSPPNDGVMNAPGRVMHAMWVASAWTTPTAVSAEATVTDPGFGFASGGRLMATWTEAVFGSGGPIPKTIASVWTPCDPGAGQLPRLGAGGPEMPTLGPFR